LIRNTIACQLLHTPKKYGILLICIPSRCFCIAFRSVKEIKPVANIEVKATDQGDTYECQVTVSEGGSETRHRVTLRKTDCERLAGSEASPETLVTESFRFLLEREPKESILRSFDLTVIGRYFPEYEREIAKRL